MLKILASQNLKKQSENILKNVFGICDEKQNNPIAFISREISLNDFLKITDKKANDLIIEYSDKTEDKYLNASIYLELSSKLIIDLNDKSLYDNDLESIRRMIIPLKYKHNVKDIYIDNLDKINVTELINFKNQEFITEYKIMKLYYISKKFELNFYIGMELIGNKEKPKFIKHLTFGNSFDMIDEIEYK